MSEGERSGEESAGDTEMVLHVPREPLAGRASGDPYAASWSWKSSFCGRMAQCSPQPNL